MSTKKTPEIYGDSSITSPRDFMDYLSRNGQASTCPVPKKVILCHIPGQT